MFRSNVLLRSFFEFSKEMIIGTYESLLTYSVIGIVCGVASNVFTSLNIISKARPMRENQS